MVGVDITPLTEARADEYLDRIGASRPDRADLAALAVLQRAHLHAVPFENLSIHLGEPIALDTDALFDKIVRRRRGGFCYELNGAFAALLTALGYRVELLSARVYGGDSYGPPFDHLVLRVHLDGVVMDGVVMAGAVLVDVGFGRFAEAPLRFGAAGDQADAAGVFRLDHTGDQIDVTMDGKPGYRLDTRVWQLPDFVPTCWWQQTSPDSHFTRSVTCSMPTATGRVTLSGTKLITQTPDGGERVERTLGSDAEVLAAYRVHFGIVLDRVPVVTPGSQL
jgi:N-hydroxyarylamine O-acetyltransferase